MRFMLALAGAALLMASPGIAHAENAPGVTATEIKLGQTSALVGVANTVAVPLTNAERAYFQMINDRGGVNGRKITLIAYDDGFDPKRTVVLTRKLIEDDRVAAMFATFGTPGILAVRDDLNANKIPQLFIVTGADIFDYKKYPWTIGGVPVFRNEAQVFGRYILVNLPAAKIAVLGSDDDMGAAYVMGLKQVFGDDYDKHVVKAAIVPDTSRTIAPEIEQLRQTGATILITAVAPLLSAEAIALAHDSGWNPIQFVNFAASGGPVLNRAGPAKAKGIITANSYADASDPRWVEDGSLKPYEDFFAKYSVGDRRFDKGYGIAGYVAAQAMVQVLTQCGDDLSRDNIMRQAMSLKDFHPVGLVPGISFYTSRTKYRPIIEAALQRFDGEHWIQFGDIMAGF
jgi:branched-chain amino acid transport system substrate-binding protein